MSLLLRAQSRSPLTLGSHRVTVLTAPQAPLLDRDPDHAGTPGTARCSDPACGRGAWRPRLCVHPSALGQVTLFVPESLQPALTKPPLNQTEFVDSYIVQKLIY